VQWHCASAPCPVLPVAQCIGVTGLSTPGLKLATLEQRFDASLGGALAVVAAMLFA